MEYRSACDDLADRYTTVRDRSSLDKLRALCAMGLGQCIMAAAPQMTGSPAADHPTLQPLHDFTGVSGK